jgi:hypothetical protein
LDNSKQQQQQQQQLFSNKQKQIICTFSKLFGSLWLIIKK